MKTTVSKQSHPMNLPGTRRTLGLLLVLAVALAPAAGAATVFEESGGVCEMEAEAATVNLNGDTVNWFQKKDPQSSGGVYMTTLEADKAGYWYDACELSFQVKINTPGEYSIAVRQIGVSGANSAQWGVDGDEISSNAFELENAEWTWAADSATVNLTAGMHTINIRRREASWKLDKIVIAKDPGDLPVVGHGTEAADSGRKSLAVVYDAAPAWASELDEAFVNAVRHGRAMAVGSLLKKGAEVNAAAPDGATALHWAVHLDAPDTAALLLRAGAMVNATNRYGVSPLMLACTNGNEAMVTLLLEAGAGANTATPEGETPLMIAARTGKPEVVRMLLVRGAKPNAREGWRGQTSLMWAAAEGHVQAVQALLEGGAETGLKSESGFTAFLFAARQGKISTVQTLLKAGAEVNQSLHGKGAGPTALGLAVTNAHYELAAHLLDAGADPNTVWKGHTVLHTITWVRRPGSGTNRPAPPGSGKMGSLEFVRKLIKHGADVNARMTSRSAGVRTHLNMRGATPFLLAARTADAELMRLLADLGADPLLPNSDHTTPLLVAAGVGVQSPEEDPGSPIEVFEAVKIALTLGNDVNAVDDRGETVMHGVAYKYAASAVPFLVENGAKIEIWNRKNKLGWTPLRIATGVHRAMNLRSSPETAAAIREVMIAAGVSTVIEPETNISGATK